MGKGAQKDGGQTPLKERMENRFAKIIEVRHDFDKESMMIIPGSERTIKPPSSQPTTSLAGQRGFSLFSQNQFLVNLTDDPYLCPVCAKRSSSLQRNNGCNIPFQHGGATHGYSYQNCNIFPSWVFSIIHCHRNFFFFISAMCIPNFLCIPNFSSFQACAFQTSTSHSSFLGKATLKNLPLRGDFKCSLCSYFPFSRYLDTASLLYSWYSSYC